MAENQEYVMKKLIIGPKLKEKREELGVTQAQAAKALGYKYGNFVGMLETGASRFPIEKWKRYADYFGFPRHEFLKIVLSELYPEMLPYLDFHPSEADLAKKGTAKAKTTDRKK